MLKKAVQQGRSERIDEVYASVRWASERSENDTGGDFFSTLLWFAILHRAWDSIANISSLA